MLRKLAIAIAASGAMMSAGYVQALGMGDIELESALNQPLDARIKLIKADDLENWEIKPALASEDAFNKAGVERIFFLNNLKFEVERENGDVYVNVKSQKAVVEPFLNFLVQVDWPNGRLQREYTLLLDPPVFDEEQGIAPVNVASEAPAQDSVQQDDSMVETQPEPSLPGTYAEPDPAPEAMEPEYQQEDAMEEQAAAPAQPQALVYEVRDNDTLWEVAIRTRPNRNISPQQAMLAIQDLNPEAFINGNINRLKKDQTLEVPTEEQMLSRTFDQAVAEVAAQNKAIAQRKAQLDATRKEQARELDTELAESELKLLAGGDATSDMDRQASGQVAKDTLGDQSSLEQELSLALENLDKSSRENQELRNRLDSLEDQIGTLQRLINLKDEQMVALQAGMSAEEIEGMGQDDAMPAGEMASEEPAQGTESEEADLNFAQDAEQASQQETAPEQPVAAEEPKEVKKPEPKPAPLPPEDKPFDPVAFAIENPPVLGGVLGALLLALLGVKYARKRKEEKAADDLADTQFEADQDPLGDVEVDGDFDDEFSDLELNTDESPLDSDFASSDDDASGLPDSLDQDESNEDVLGQVDVYMAYDRVDSAKSLLEETLEKQPQRHELRLKLLEILAESDMGDEFASQYDWLQANAGEAEQTQANQIKARFEGQDGGDFDSDLSMDDDLDLGMDMMSGSDGNDDLSLDDLDLGESTSSQSDSNELEMDFSDSDLDLSFDEPEQNNQADFSSEEAGELEFNLDDDLDVSFDTDSDNKKPSADAENKAENSLDFDSELEFEGSDLSESDDLSLDEDLPVLETESSAADDDNALEFDGDFDLPELTPEEPKATSLESDDDDLSLDFEGLEEASDDSGNKSDDLDVEFSLDEMDDAPSLEMSAEETPTLENADDDLPVLDAESSDDEFDFEAEFEGFDSNEDSSDNDALDLDISDEIDGGEEALTLDQGLELDQAAEEALPEAAEDISFESDEDLSLDIEDETAPVAEAPASEEASSVESDLASDLSDEDPLTDFDIGEDLENLDGDLDFLSGTDESETKLDLARAYIDMDDKEGAREILQEVMEEGSDDHKKEATKLLDSIA